MKIALYKTSEYTIRVKILEHTITEYKNDVLVCKCGHRNYEHMFDAKCKKCLCSKLVIDRIIQQPVCIDTYIVEILEKPENKSINVKIGDRREIKKCGNSNFEIEII